MYTDMLYELGLFQSFDSDYYCIFAIKGHMSTEFSSPWGSLEQGWMVTPHLTGLSCGFLCEICLCQTAHMTYIYIYIFMHTLYILYITIHHIELGVSSVQGKLLVLY